MYAFSYECVCMCAAMGVLCPFGNQCACGARPAACDDAAVSPVSNYDSILALSPWPFLSNYTPNLLQTSNKNHPSKISAPATEEPTHPRTSAHPPIQPSTHPPKQPSTHPWNPFHLPFSRRLNANAFFPCTAQKTLTTMTINERH